MRLSQDPPRLPVHKYNRRSAWSHSQAHRDCTMAGVVTPSHLNHIAAFFAAQARHVLAAMLQMLIYSVLWVLAYERLSTHCSWLIISSQRP